jgi:hypothetical protein
MQTRVVLKIRENGNVQLQSEQHEQLQNYLYMLSKVVAMTDYKLKEIIIRNDIAKFGNYLHELIHGVLDRSHSYQLREALAWYYTLKLTEQHKYTRPSYPIWVDHVYIVPVKKLAKIVGNDFLRDLALGSGSIEENAFPIDVKRLFLSEESFYC